MHIDPTLVENLLAEDPDRVLTIQSRFRENPLSHTCGFLASHYFKWMLRDLTESEAGARPRDVKSWEDDFVF